MSRRKSRQVRTGIPAKLRVGGLGGKLSGVPLWLGGRDIGGVIGSSSRRVFIGSAEEEREDLREERRTDEEEDVADSGDGPDLNSNSPTSATSCCKTISHCCSWYG